MLFEKLKSRFPKLRENEPLKNHCTFRVGGPADCFYELTNIAELPDLITIAEKNAIPYKVIGRGTNVLFTDKGFRGLIIKNISKEMRVDDDIIEADSGVLLSQVIRASVDYNLTGLEPLYGLPGTVGAALWGNAGVPKTELSSFLQTATIFNPADGIREVNKEGFIFKYRSSSLQKAHDIVLKIKIKLIKGQAQLSKELMKKIDEIRRGKQPIGYSAGSFFKNPSPEKSAGFLIESVGLKGASVGDAEISHKHANFFMNKGHATAAQILKLAELAKGKVKKKHGIDLEMEVKIIGEL